MAVRLILDTPAEGAPVAVLGVFFGWLVLAAEAGFDGIRR